MKIINEVKSLLIHVESFFFRRQMNGYLFQSNIGSLRLLDQFRDGKTRLCTFDIVLVTVPSSF